MTGGAVFFAAMALTSGLHGTVTMGPTSPVCIAGQPCSQPAADVTLVFTRYGRSRRVTTTAVGRYRVALVPGRYAVRAIGAGFGFRPTAVTVRPGLFRLVNFTIDTGIR